MFIFVLVGLIVVGGVGLYDHKVIDVTDSAPYVKFDATQFNNGDHRFSQTVVAPTEYDNDWDYLDARKDN